MGAKIRGTTVKRLMCSSLVKLEQEMGALNDGVSAQGRRKKEHEITKHPVSLSVVVTFIVVSHYIVS